MTFCEPGKGPRVMETDLGLRMGLFIGYLSLRRCERDQVLRDSRDCDLSHPPPKLWVAPLGSQDFRPAGPLRQS